MLDTGKPSTSLLAFTIDLPFSQAKNAIQQDTQCSKIFNDLIHSSHNHFVPVTASAPLQRLTGLAVATRHMLGDFLRNVREPVAGTIVREHKLFPTGGIVQSVVRKVIDRHYSAFFPVFLSVHFDSNRRPSTDIESMWSHLDSFLASNTAGVAIS